MLFLSPDFYHDEMMKEKKNPAGRHEELLTGEKDLILYNDDFNTFEFVIETLVEICGHDQYQAEQCALVAHFKGNCTVQTGPVEILKSMCDEMTNRKLTVAIL